MRRMVTDQDRATLDERLVVWKGSPPFDVLSDPASLAGFAREAQARYLIIDSLKDLAPKLSDEDTGMAMHRAWQLCLESGVETCTLHHPRKAQGDNKKPRTLADVYGSRWLTAGCGSVVLIWGDAGDAIVDLEHLKQPANVVGPMTLLHDNAHGATTVEDSNDVVAIVAAHTGPALTATDIAAKRKKDPAKNDIEKARRQLDGAVKAGRLERMEIVGVRGDGIGYIVARREAK